jgi:hypothetical protein
MPFSLQELLRQAEFVFRGRITKFGATTMSEVRASEKTAVVAVDEVYRAPGVLPLLAGKTITVLLSADRSLQVGESSVFLARGWLFGSSIAVQEVGEWQGQVNFQNLPGQLAAQEQKAADEALRNRIAAAPLVVAGKVTDTKPVEVLQPFTISEHSPQWWEATIQVTSIEKGAAPGGPVVVLYPASIDIMWYQSPKFHPGQEGIWILNRGPIEGMDREAFTALQPLDFHPTSEVGRIRHLLQSPG